MEKASSRYTSTPSRPPATKSVDWKVGLRLKFSPYLIPHQLEKLIKVYIKDNVPPGQMPSHVSSLVSESMREHEVEGLRAILTNEDMESVFNERGESLCIQGSVDVSGWQTLAKAIPDGFSLKSVKLEGMVLDEEMAEHMLDALSLMPQLDSLVLDLVVVEMAGRTAAEKALGKMAGPNLKIQTLEIQALGSRDRPDFDCNALPLLLKLCGNNSEVTTLHLSAWNAKNYQYYALFDVLLKGAVTDLRFRNIPANDMDPPDLSPIAKIPNLLKLDLSGSSLQPYSMESLLVALKEEENRLEKLDLSGNLVRERTVIALASLLESHKTLQWLEFNNPRGDVTCKPRSWTPKELQLLTDALRTNTSLLHLDIGMSDHPLLQLAPGLLARNNKYLGDPL